jgi:hypothetical protein
MLEERGWVRKRPGFEWAGMLARDGSGVGVGVCVWCVWCVCVVCVCGVCVEVGVGVAGRLSRVKVGRRCVCGSGGSSPLEVAWGGTEGTVVEANKKLMAIARHQEKKRARPSVA